MMYLSILLLIAAFPSINCIAQRTEINRIAEELEKNGGDVTNLVKRNSMLNAYRRLLKKLAKKPTAQVRICDLILIESTGLLCSWKVI